MALQERQFSNHCARIDFKHQKRIARDNGHTATQERLWTPAGWRSAMGTHDYLGQAVDTCRVVVQNGSHAVYKHVLSGIKEAYSQGGSAGWQSATQEQRASGGGITLCTAFSS
eukprot:TRINITY_DN29952_c0_g1_i2.p1 TRINITY_DN29952_c0_g1~~TRINITY_DN29952_c0_g1_i2.p1  ORF type:complete len:113 (-),score=14.59 TRINITY_DN29952_c0_g1_i2:26-364(-)